MGVSGQMDPLDFLTNEQLLLFLRRKKTEISCIEQPHAFLTQLRDHDLLTEKLFEKVKAMRTREQKQKGVYAVLDWLEKEKPQCVHQFWHCVFKHHILQLYPTLQLLRNSLMDGTFESYENCPNVETQTENSEGKGKKGKDKKNTRKRKKNDRSCEDSDDPGPSSASTPTRKKPAKKPLFSSPVKKGEKAEMWTWPLYKTQLTVNCGDKVGTLYREKLPKGEKCILSEGLWFTPSGFEKFGGKEKCKNWKVSIRCSNTTLKKLIEENHLQPPPMERRKRKCAPKSMKEQFPDISAESSSTDSEARAASDEESDAEDFQQQRGREGGIEFRGRVENDEEEEEEEMTDLSVFQAPSLPVTCVSLTGTLYKDRFASGSRGKCIRTEERWFTPEEFVKQEPTLTDEHWKKDILCHGKTFNFLVKKEILRIHSLLCDCVRCSHLPKYLSINPCAICKFNGIHINECNRYGVTCKVEVDDADSSSPQYRTNRENCTSTGVMAQNNDDVCYVCHSEGKLVCCDECPRAFHSNCHLPAVEEDLPGEWICTFCVLKTSQQWRDSMSMTEQEAFNAPVSQYKMHCHCLLLWLYKEDTQRVFVKDPRQTVSRYSQFISQPMWLDRIKLKLESDKYQTVEAFISDVQLIFSNCRTFNRDNEFGQMGARLKVMFDKEFQKIFTIQEQLCEALNRH